MKGCRVRLDRIDHIVLTVSDIERTCDFYSRVLGMKVLEFGEGRKALWFGGQKINLHHTRSRIEPRANTPTPGSSDLCLIVRGSLSAAIAHLEDSGIKHVLGPVARDGALGRMYSVYFRDPDKNLIELASYRKSVS